MKTMTHRDYIYCEDCKTFVDLWKFGHSIADAGHEGCNWRYVTNEELSELVKECRRHGCFQQNA